MQARTHRIPTTLIAPCGMDCALCIAHAREKNPCPGCRGGDSGKPKTRRTCRIKTCATIRKGKARYCFTCSNYPCDRLEHLDERYRTKYGMSMIENLMQIKKTGIRRFITNEKRKWTCPGCGRLLCVHKSQCLSCGQAWR
jgi:hypothetical protein